MSDPVNKDIRILHLVRSMHVGGLEMVVLNLCKGLNKVGIASHLGCLIEQGEWGPLAEVAGHWDGDLQNAGPLKTLCSLLSYIRREKITIIHTHNSHPHKYGAVASLLTGVPLLHTKHGRNWPDNPKWVWFSRQLSRFTKLIVPVSCEIEQIVLDIEKVPEKKVETILNGVDDDHFTSGPSELRAELPEDAFVVGSVGRLSPEKCYTELVEAFAMLQKRVRQARLVIVGEGVEREAIRIRAEECGVLDAVWLPGTQSNVREWLRAFDLFCLSSDQEGTSVTLIEAGMCSLPAVVTGVGGNPEIVEHDVTGLVVPYGDIPEMASAFEALAGDHVRRRDMGRAARLRMQERYSIGKMITEYVAAYQKVAE